MNRLGFGLLLMVLAGTAISCKAGEDDDIANQAADTFLKKHNIADKVVSSEIKYDKAKTLYYALKTEHGSMKVLGDTKEVFEYGSTRIVDFDALRSQSATAKLKSEQDVQNWLKQSFGPNLELSAPLQSPLPIKVTIQAEDSVNKFKYLIVVLAPSGELVNYSVAMSKQLTGDLVVTEQDAIDALVAFGKSSGKKQLLAPPQRIEERMDSLENYAYLQPEQKLLRPEVEPGYRFEYADGIVAFVSRIRKGKVAVLDPKDCNCEAPR